MARVKQKKIHEYDSRLEIFEGKMGAGKSYFAVRRMDRVIREQARPVYTNLPIKFRVYRKYLRDRQGESAANLIHELTESHWRRFIRRQHEFSDFKTKVEGLIPSNMDPAMQREIVDACERFYPENPPSLEKLQRENKLFINQIIAWFDATHGDPILEGPEANHIPPASIIIIDELQKWHPMHKQSADKDREYLLSYITMSRHHAHWIWVLTQDAMNVAIEFRRLAHLIWSIWNRSGDVIVPGVRFETLRLRAMGYAKQTPEEYEQSKNRQGIDKKAYSQELFTIITNLPSAKLFYRFYSSETHLGSRRQLMKKLKQARIASGIDDESVELHEQEKESTMKGRIYAKMYQVVAALVAVCAAFLIGRQTIGTSEVQAEQLEAALVWPDWTMVSKTPWIGGRPTQVGMQVGTQGATLRYISDDLRSLVFIARDDFWLWEFGKDPFRVGAVEDVQTAVAGVRAAEIDRASGTISINQASDRAEVGAGDGFD